MEEQQFADGSLIVSLNTHESRTLEAGCGWAGPPGDWGLNMLSYLVIKLNVVHFLFLCYDYEQNNLLSNDRLL